MEHTVTSHKTILLFCLDIQTGCNCGALHFNHILLVYITQVHLRVKSLLLSKELVLEITQLLQLFFQRPPRRQLSVKST